MLHSSSWQTVISSILALTLGLSTVSCAAPHQTLAQPRITFAGEPPAWAASASSVMTELEQWRGLTFKTALEVTFQPQDDPRLNGWYNSETKQLVVTTSGSEQLERGVLLHEMFHALQDQHFDLYRLHLQSQHEPDYDKAVTAVIEGEAMLAVSELMNYDFLAHAQLPAEGPISDQLFENIFLYGAGLKFIQTVRDEGGWAAVDAVFADPPQATTLILNPERYLAGERSIAPVEIPLNPNETLKTTAIRGEYEVRRLLARQPETRPLVETVGRSYVADTLGVITKNNRTMHRWVIEFNHPDSAESLAMALATALETDLEQQPIVAVDDESLVLDWSH